MKRLMIYGVLIAVLLLILPVAVAAAPTTLTVFLHNDQVELTQRIYYVDTYIGTTYLGRYRSGDTFTVNAPANLKFRAWTGSSIRGPDSFVTIADGDTLFSYEYATVKVELFGGPDELDDPDTYYVEIAGIGKVGSGEFFHVPVGARIAYQACTKSICGPIEYTSFADAGAGSLRYDYSVVTVQLFNGATELNDEEWYYLEIGEIGNKGSGEKFFVPADTSVSYRAWTGAHISGPELQATINAGAQMLEYEYATVKIRLYTPADPTHAATELIDKTKYCLEISGIGNLGYNDVFHVPENAVFSYRACAACTGTPIRGPWLSASFAAGEQTFNVEYAAVTVRLYNGNTQLVDRNTYSVEVQNIGTMKYNDVFYVPSNADISFRAWTGSTICGPWVPTSFSAGNRILNYEYATVKFVFDLSGGSCTMQTAVTGIGNVPNGGKVHVPDNADVSFRADVCGWLSGVKTITFYSGEGTVKWSMTATYTRP